MKKVVMVLVGLLVTGSAFAKTPIGATFQARGFNCRIELSSRFSPLLRQKSFILDGMTLSKEQSLGDCVNAARSQLLFGKDLLVTQGAKSAKAEFYFEELSTNEGTGSLPVITQGSVELELDQN